MATTSSSTSVVVFDPAFTDSERVALAGFLAGYLGATRDAYGLDLGQFVGFLRPSAAPPVRGASK